MLFKQYHPDGSEPDIIKFQTLSKAKQVLKNDVQRANYLLKLQDYKEKQVFDKDVLMKQMEIGKKRESYTGDKKTIFIQEINQEKDQQLQKFAESYSKKDFQNCEKILSYLNFLDRQISQDKEQSIMGQM